jgi:hypothetical protein
MPLEIDGFVRADCALARDSPVRKCADVGSCNPRSRRLDFELTVRRAKRRIPCGMKGAHPYELLSDRVARSPA